MTNQRATDSVTPLTPATDAADGSSAPQNRQTIVLYSFAGAPKIRAVIKAFRVNGGEASSVTLLASRAFVQRQGMPADSAMVFGSPGEFMQCWQRLRRSRYDEFAILTTFTSFSPKFLLRLGVMTMVGYLSCARRVRFYNLDNSAVRFSVAVAFKKLAQNTGAYLSIVWGIGFLRISAGLAAGYFWIAQARRRAGPLREDDVRKILLIQIDLIGDVVWLTPCLALLKQRFPHTELHVLVGSWAADIVKTNPAVDRVIEFDELWFGQPAGGVSVLADWKRRAVNIRTRIALLREKYDVAIDMRGDPRTISLAYFTGALVRVAYHDRALQNYAAYLLNRAVAFPWETFQQTHIVRHNINLLSVLGIQASDEEPTIPVDDRAGVRVAAFLKEQGVTAADTLVGLHPGSSRLQKQWHAEGFAAVADALIRRFGVKIVITGSRAELPLARRIASLMTEAPVIAAGELRLSEFVALVAQCRLLISNESAGISIASAVKTPLVCLMSGVPALFGPYHVASRVLIKDLECRDPVFEHCFCDASPYRCLQEVQPLEVIDAAAELLANVDRTGKTVSPAGA